MSTDDTPIGSSPRRAHLNVALKLFGAVLLSAFFVVWAIWPWLNAPLRPQPGPSVAPVPNARWRDAKWRNFDDDAKVVSLAELAHNDRRLFERLLRIDAKAREFAAPSYSHVPYTRQGRYIKAGWATHANEKECIEWPWRPVPVGEAHFVSVGTYCYEQDSSGAFGIELEAEFLPADSGWSARVSYHDDAGARIRGKGAIVIFAQRGQQWRRYDGGIHVILPMDRLLQVLATPESLRDFAVSQIEHRMMQLDEELKTFESDLAAGILQHVEYVRGPYRGDGIPPEMEPKTRPYTSAERPTVLADKAREVTERRSREQQKIDALRSDYREMHRAMTKAFPLHECW